MKLEIPGQLRGSDTRKVVSAAIKLRRKLEPYFAALGEETLTLISPILRVGGELGTFGADGIENIKIANRQAECDVVVEARNWSAMSDDQITAIIRPRVIEALSTLITEAGFGDLPSFLLEETKLAEQDGANQPAAAG